jgi:hypothetical protein
MLPSNMSHCEKCGEVIEWHRDSGWVHVYNTECLEFVYNEATIWDANWQMYITDWDQVRARKGD